MTVSFHKYNGEFFPQTGRLDDNGGGLGKHFALNVPLLDGIDDDSYLAVFKSVIDDTITAFRPSAIVLQCGADSLGCDRLGAFNLSIAAHGECVNFVRKFNVPLLVVGGGGYTVHNVSRCWTYETSVLVGAQIPDELPCTMYDAWFADDYTLHPTIVGKVDNQNSPESLKRITSSIRQKLRYLQGAPSVQMQEIPPNLVGWLEDEERSAQEMMEEQGTAVAGEFRQDPSKAQNEFFDSETDVDKEEEVSVVTRGRGAAPTRRGRGRGGRGRGRGRGAAVAATPANQSMDYDAAGQAGEDIENQTPAPTIGGSSVAPSRVPTRGRGRGGRGRRGGRKPRQSAAAKEKEAEKEAEKDAEETEVGKDDVDVEDKGDKGDRGDKEEGTRGGEGEKNKDGDEDEKAVEKEIVGKDAESASAAAMEIG